jgi:PleD family two-component response regulator
MDARVLVVDDQRSSQQLLLRAVGALGYGVIGADDGAAALTVLREPPGGTAVDVVLLDVVMPVMDGFATLEAIKADERLAHLPVLLVSAIDEVDRVAHGIELGATDYLTKPVRRQLLAARLRASLADKRLRDVERDHLQQVGHVIDAAAAIEAGRDPTPGLTEVAGRDDALGSLARTVERMAAQVREREGALLAQVEQLRVALDRERLDARVAEVTGTDYFRQLRDDAGALKGLLDDGPEATRESGDG